MREKIKKITAVLLAVVIMSAMLSVGAVSASASTGGRSQADAVNWANSKINQSLDYDGAYGAQCVDLIMFYYQYLGNSSPGGNGCDYTWNALPSGWSRITNYSGFVPQPGDICVWGSYCWPATTEYGHVGIVISGNASNFNSVEQNVSGQYVQAISNRSTSSVTCFIRPDFISDTTAPTISNARAENMSASSFDIKCDLNDDVGVTRVWLNIYGPSGQNGYEVAASNGAFSHRITTQSYGGAGLYTVHIYAFDAAGHQTSAAVSNIKAINDTVAPTITNAKAVNPSASEFTITCELNDNVGVTRVYVIVYSPDGTQNNGYNVSASNGTFSHTIKTAQYGGAGIYKVHLYVFDAAGNQAPCAITNIEAVNDTKAPTITDAKAINQSSSEFTITCELNDNVGVTRVYIIVYSPNGKQNNGYNVSANNGTFAHTIKTDQYGGAGVYVIHMYAFDEAGNQAPSSIRAYAYNDPSSTIEYNKHRYELFDTRMTWKHAKEICESRGGHLATINSAEENDKLTNLASSLSNYVWIGGSDEGSEGNWYWVNGDNFTYSNWYSGEPSNSDNKEHYLSLYGKTGMWNDAANDNQYISGFICEYEPEIKTVIGDVNGDEMVDVLDAAMVQKYTVNRASLSDEQLAVADVNNDNHVDVLDAAEIQKYAAGIISEFKKKV